MMKRLEHLSYKESLRKPGLFSVGSVSGTSFPFVQICVRRVERRQSLCHSAQWQGNTHWAQADREQILFQHTKKLWDCGLLLLLLLLVMVLFGFCFAFDYFWHVHD